MLTYFTCPDGTQRKVSDCLAQCPLPNGRCLSLPTLTEIGRTRAWHGTPSTTQCLNPTRLEYLSIVKPYAIDPFDQAFALLGTRHHQRLEAVAKQIEGLESEKYLKGETSGILDLLEPINGGGEYRMIDYKSFGSYATAKHLGIKAEGENDRYKLALQMNNYRCLAATVGFHVTELKVQITVRDGNTRSARENGVDKNLYLLPVAILPDDDVREYFLSKAFALTEAMATGITELCGYDDRWGGRRCKGYCNVAAWCAEGAKVNRVPLKE